MNTGDSSHPVYAVDSLESIIEDDDPWKINKFGKNHSILNVNSFDERIPGVQLSYMNVGMEGTFFCVHTEDSELASLNVMVKGAPKVWYTIPYSEKEKFEKTFSSLLKGIAFECGTPIRHKCFLIPPWVLKKYGIKFSRHVQYPGEVMFTLYGAYHFGFNSGFNVCESVNIASPMYFKFHSGARLCESPCLYVKNNINE